MEEAHERKKLKNDNLLGQCRSNCWKASCLPIEEKRKRFYCKMALAWSGLQKVEQLNQCPIQPIG